MPSGVVNFGNFVTGSRVPSQLCVAGLIAVTTNARFYARHNWKLLQHEPVWRTPLWTGLSRGSPCILNFISTRGTLSPVCKGSCTMSCRSLTCIIIRLLHEAISYEATENLEDHFVSYTVFTQIFFFELKLLFGWASLHRSAYFTRSVHTCDNI